MDLSRRQVVEHRIAAQQLDREPAVRALTDAAIFDLGVQDTGRDGASWALVNRGVPVARPSHLEACEDLGLVWTLRASPHYYRRSDLADVWVATSPFSEADAVKRVVGAGKPLKEAGVTTLDGLAEVATRLREVVTEPRSKGEVSTQLTSVLAEPYLRSCVPCDAVHSWEVPFRIGALYGGLELQPGTSPPVLQRIPNWSRRQWGPAPDPLSAPARLQPIRRYLEFQGPATPRDVAAFLDAPVTEVKKHWPEEAVSVRLNGQERWMIGEPKTSTGSELVRLLGPYDLLLQGRDRDLLVPAVARHKQLWPIIGRPGAIMVAVDLVGSWRPAAGGSLTVRGEPWTKITKRDRSRIGQQAERLAAHRGVIFSTVEYAP